GDWLETNEKFPIGLEGIATAIREAGFEPGLWTAPFAASAESWALRMHPEWALTDRSGSGEESRWLRGTYNPEWSQNGWVYALDTGHPGCLLHLEAVFKALADLGFVYQKLDFLYMAAMEGASSDPSQTRAGRLRDGLAAIRRGAGEQAFLLGCGSPLGPAVGWVDSMRMGPDVAPSWEVDQPLVIPGMELALPSTHGALRSAAARLFTHRRLWINDPDCLMARSRDTDLSRDEVGSLAALIGVSGGLGVFSDDVGQLGEAERQLIAAVDQQRKRVDQPEWGRVRIFDPLNAADHVVLNSWVGPHLDQAQINLAEEARDLHQTPGLHGLPSSEVPELTGTDKPAGSKRLAPHASQVTRFPHARGLTIFCDFDGTFSVSDVGSSIAQKWLHEERVELGKRYQSGEVDAWTYAEMLFNGFAFGKEELEDFLKTIDLDPGAHSLLEWCASHSIPFKILSDGFDFNLEALQRIHDLRFDFVANQLRIEDGIWNIRPGGRNPDCDCGTGVCKRAIVEARRKEAPLECIVHIGNGQVSDRCGAEAADLAFAKETLAEDLAARGVPFRPFETLLDVVASLNAGWATDLPAVSGSRRGDRSGLLMSGPR
ncbi:HAD-IB family phosphatase, partial [Myxococcota bacterium]|nr:HAD-IB family phosphatase [Myxococcota bacterium]